MSIALQQMKDTVYLLQMIDKEYSKDKVDLLHNKVHEAIANCDIYGYVKFIMMTIDLSIHNGTIKLNVIRFTDDIDQYIPSNL